MLCGGIAIGLGLLLGLPARPAAVDWYVSQGANASDTNGGGPSGRVGVDDGPVYSLSAGAGGATASDNGADSNIEDLSGGGWFGVLVGDYLCWDVSGTPQWTIVTACNVGGDPDVITVAPQVTAGAQKACRVGGYFATVRQACAVADLGAAIHIGPGDYDESSEPLNPPPVSLFGAGPGNTTITGSLLMDGAGTARDVTISDIGFDGTGVTAVTHNDRQALLFFDDCNVSADDLKVRNIIGDSVRGLYLWVSDAATRSTFTRLDMANGDSDLFSCDGSTEYRPRSSCHLINPWMGDPGPTNTNQTITSHGGFTLLVEQATILLSQGQAIQGEGYTPVVVLGAYIRTSGDTYHTGQCAGAFLRGVDTNAFLLADTDNGVIRECRTTQGIKMYVDGLTGVRIEWNEVCKTDFGTAINATSVAGGTDASALVIQNNVIINLDGGRAVNLRRNDQHVVRNNYILRQPRDTGGDTEVMWLEGDNIIVEENCILADMSRAGGRGVIRVSDGVNLLVRNNWIRTLAAPATAFYGCVFEGNRDWRLEGNYFDSIHTDTAAAAAVYEHASLTGHTSVVACANIFDYCGVPFKLQPTLNGHTYTYNVSNNVCKDTTQTYCVEINSGLTNSNSGRNRWDTTNCDQYDLFGDGGLGDGDEEGATVVLDGSALPNPLGWESNAASVDPTCRRPLLLKLGQMQTWPPRQKGKQLSVPLSPSGLQSSSP